MKNAIGGALLFAGAGVLVASAQQATFTVTATAGFTHSDYVTGTDYTFVFEVSGLGARSVSSVGFAGGDFLWVAEQVAEGTLWSSLGGTAFVASAGTGTNPDDYLGVAAATGSGALYLKAGRDENGSVSMPLSTPGTVSRGLRAVTVDFDAITGLTLTAPTEYLSPGDYFASRAGVYLGATGTVTLLPVRPIRSEEPLVFAVKSLEIVVAPSPVPEPASAGALAGTLALAATLARRRRGVRAGA